MLKINNFFVLACLVVSFQIFAAPKAMPISLRFRLEACSSQSEMEKIMDIISANEFDLLDSTDPYGRSPLFIAAETGNIGLVRWLKYVQSPIINDNNGRSPLAIAMENSRIACVRALSGYLPLKIEPVSNQVAIERLKKIPLSERKNAVNKFIDYVLETYGEWEDDPIARQAQFCKPSQHKSKKHAAESL